MRKIVQIVGIITTIWLGMQFTTQEVSAKLLSYTSDPTSAEYKEAIVSLNTTNAVANTPAVVESVVYEPNYYEVGQCTWGAKELAPWAGTYWGNGGEWADSARAAGFEVGSIPKVGSIMVWTDGGYGHVAVVTEVRADGYIQVSESNYSGNQTIGNYRGWFHPDDESDDASISYIYPKV